MVYIFIRNKLISVDSILPVAMEIFEKTGIQSTFITFDKRTYNYIVENVLIYENINKVGKLKFIGKTNSKYISRFKKGIFLLKICLEVLLRKTFLIHFSHLSRGILSIPTILNKPERTFFAETDASGYSKFMFTVGSCRGKNRVTVKDQPAPKAGSLLHFGNEWLWLEDERVSHLKRYHHPYPRERSTWHNYIVNNTHKYFETEKPIIFFLITGFCHLPCIKNENTTREKFEETLHILNEECKDHKILIKPHPISDLNEVKSIIAKFPQLDIELTYLHPSILGNKAKITIGNFYSTAMYDSQIFGTPTIEFTDYFEKALEISGGRSQRPDHVDHFIQNDPEEFRRLLRHYMKADKKVIKPVENTIDSEFIKLFR